MKITFVSNYMNHHQMPTADALYERLGENYRFIQTEPMEEERVNMGWGEAISKRPYVLCYWEQQEVCRQLIMDSDILIFGGVEDESYIEERLKQGKIVLRYCERLYKEGTWRAISPRGLKKKYHDHTKYRKAPVYLLCAGGYVAYDFDIIKAYPNKKFKWGYFPKAEEYLWNDLIAKKQNEVTEILWAGRLIPLKHPEEMIALAKRLQNENQKFHMTMIGGGELEESLRKTAAEEGLAEVLTIAGMKLPNEVRSSMEKANIFLFTSDFHEGWGAVLNESMNSGCAVVASHAIGGASFLIEDGVNGKIYKNGDKEELFHIVKELINNPYMHKKMGENAYQTITSKWNPKYASEVLLTLCEKLQKGQEEDLFEADGPLSKAEVVPERKMYAYLKNNHLG